MKSISISPEVRLSRSRRSGRRDLCLSLLKCSVVNETRDRRYQTGFEYMPYCGRSKSMPYCGRSRSNIQCRSERFLNEYGSGGLADVLARKRVAGVLGFGVAVVRADVVSGNEPCHAEFPVGVIQGVAVAEPAVIS